MKTLEIKCDACEADLTSTGNSIDWRLTLTPEQKPSRGGFVTDMMIYPAVEREHHFCGLPCLDYWRDRERYRETLLSEWHRQWTEEKGTKHGHGSYSYPEPSREIRSTCNAEIAAKVDERFPFPRNTKASRATPPLKE